MASKFKIILVLIFTASCQKASNNYYIGKQSKLLGIAGANYILAEKKGDSLQIWYITDDWNAGYFESSQTETLPFKITKGKNFEIKQITSNKIVGSQMNLHGVSDLKTYFKLRNEVEANKIESDFDDSIKRILQVKYKGILFTHKVSDTKTKSELTHNLHCDSFPERYRQYLQSNLENVKSEAESKKKYYSDILNGKVQLDSTEFEKFIGNYDHGYYDRLIFYCFIRNRPELFFLQINLNTVEPDVCYCDGCFTKEQLDEMYCALKPLRNKNPNKLWMFERYGNLKCHTN